MAPRVVEMTPPSTPDVCRSLPISEVLLILPDMLGGDVLKIHMRSKGGCRHLPALVRALHRYEITLFLGH